MRHTTFSAGRIPLVLVALFSGASIVVTSPRAANAADERHCDGPPECCPTTLADSLPSPQTVRIGVVLIGLHNITERGGTWDADYYLYESWTPLPGFTPQTEVVNEVSRASSMFDETELREGSCVRTRRIRSTLSNALNLRLFPFDQQRLELRLSDAEFDSRSVRYDRRAFALGIDDQAREQLSSWKLIGNPTFATTRSAFRWEAGAPQYDYASFRLTVRRHVTYHLVRFFLPLFIIVLVAFGTFWIDPEDLSSQTSLGVTCLLAAIAFQFAQASALPEIAYLTLVDRVYAACYVAIALALAEAVYVNALARKGMKKRAVQIDRRSRIAFPVALVAAVGWAVWRSVVEGGV